jgi:hypothetical protein
LQLDDVLLLTGDPIGEAARVTALVQGDGNDDGHDPAGGAP